MRAAVATSTDSSPRTLQGKTGRRKDATGGLQPVQTAPSSLCNPRLHRLFSVFPCLTRAFAARRLRDPPRIHLTGSTRFLHPERLAVEWRGARVSASRPLADGRGSLGLRGPGHSSVVTAPPTAFKGGSRSTKSYQSLRSFPLARPRLYAEQARYGRARGGLRLATAARTCVTLRERCPPSWAAASAAPSPVGGLPVPSLRFGCPVLHGRPVGAVRFRLRREVALRAHHNPTLKQAAPVWVGNEKSPRTEIRGLGRRVTVCRYRG